MAINNKVILTGNMGSEARIVDKDEKLFAAFSIATTDSYKNDKEEWQNKETIWHDILVFNPKLIEQIKDYDKGSRIEITGALSYLFFEVSIEGGKTIKKKEASIVAKKIEPAPLQKKDFE